MWMCVDVCYSNTVCELPVWLNIHIYYCLAGSFIVVFGSNCHFKVLLLYRGVLYSV